MSKKDYELIAKTIATSTGNNNTGLVILSRLINAFEIKLSQENERFDKNLFRAACMKYYNEGK